MKWAAFYSDCEHEVLEVVEGNRITLTYNLYFSTGSGALAGRPSSLKTEEFKLYQDMKEAIANNKFYPRGQILAIPLSHAYAHTSKTPHLLPWSLKGADMHIWEICHALKLPCFLRPVMTAEEDWDTILTLVGNKFFPFMTGSCMDESGDPPISEMWPSTAMDERGVTWVRSLSDARKEAALGFAAYGNGLGDPGTSYSAAVMFIAVPSYKVRLQGEEAMEAAIKKPLESWLPVVKDSKKKYQGY